MKKLVLAPLVLAFTANAALAANSVDLRVTGTITPAACDVSLAGGDFDLGSINSSELTFQRNQRPAVGGKTLNITCSAPTQVAIKAIDNRSGSVASIAEAPSLAFGLGVDSANTPIGYYYIHLLQAGATVDGGPGKVKYGFTSTNTWETNSGPTALSSDQSRILAFDPIATAGNSVPLPITSASALIEVQASIQSDSVLDTSTEITLDGSATIELVYL